MEKWEKNIAQLVEVKITQVPIQRMIVNGEEKIINSEACVLICPICGNIIQQFNPGVPEVEILKALCTDKEEELNKTLWCTKCGQKLSLMRPLPIDAQYEVEEVKEN